MPLNGSIPQMNQAGWQKGAAALFHSERRVALLLDKTISPGFGVLRAGTILSKNISSASTGNKGLLVPYILDDSTDINQVGPSFLTASYATGETVVYVTLSDSYRFKVGDDIVIGRNSGGDWETFNGGAITAIDRTTYANKAKITFTTSEASANYTIANNAACWVECGTGSKLCTASYVLDQDVDTGEGEDSAGALTSVVVSNAILNIGVMQQENYDSQAATDLSASTDGNFFILK